MALTEIPSELSSTPSIVDNGNATAITIGSDESVALGGTLSLPNANATNEISFTGTEFTNVLSATTSGFQLGTTGAGYLQFFTGNTARMTIDGSSGNVGIGASSPTAPLSFGSITNDVRIYLRGNTNEFAIGTNGLQTVYAGYQGHVFQTGSFGGAEAMRIDSSGKLLLGTGTSGTTDLLQIETPASGGGTGIQIRRADSNTDQGVGRIQFGNNTATDLASISAKTDGATDNGALLFNTSVSGGSNTERMRISAAGVVTTPYQPAFKAGRSTDYTPIQNTAIVFNDDYSAHHFNIGGHYSTSSGRFTCPVAGRYFFHTVVIYGPTLTSGQNMADAFRILKNGSLTAYSHRRAEYVPGTTGSSGYYVDHATVVLDCAQNQYVEVNSIAFPVHGNTYYTYFTGYLIG